jgi:hypothetical protein
MRPDTLIHTNIQVKTPPPAAGGGGGAGIMGMMSGGMGGAPPAATLPQVCGIMRHYAA